MSKEFGAVFDLCLFIFENSANVKQSLLIEAVKLFADNVKWFPLEYVFREDILSRFLNDIKNMPFIRVQVMKCLGEIFGIPLDVNKIGPDQYLRLKNMTMQIYKNYIGQMIVIVNNTNFAEKYSKLDPSKLNGYEELSLQFALSLISFFKNNFTYIEEFDFPIGTTNGNDFTATYLNEIINGLNFITQIHQIPQEEIFKATSEFWNWFAFKICFIKEKDANLDLGLPMGIYESSLSNYIYYSQEMFFYKNCYSQILETVRITIISKMIKPIEVKIDIDEDGEIISDPTINTVYQSIHETMRDTLIYLTHLDPVHTEKIMLEQLQTQTVETNWNPNLLNSVSWSIGCIAGAMTEMHEKKFIVMVIKYLLNLCEMKKGKTNKAVVASNIMYVVGQYPRFLNAHWKFLKTVVKKLFEFMHEPHPGVQDFACETFLKISIKCGDQMINVNQDENEPYINVLCRNVKDDTGDLQPHQKLMFYEALGNVIVRDTNFKNKTILIQNMLLPTFNDWTSIFDQASSNPEILHNSMAIKALDILIRINERVAMSVKTAYWSFAVHIYDNLIKAYMYYTNLINEGTKQGQLPHTMKVFKSIKKTILKFIQTMIENNEDNNIIMTGILPPLSNLIDAYRMASFDNRDPDTLLVFAAILEKLKNSQFDYIVSIWKYLCLDTLEMIKMDFQSYPEHRQNFFTLVKSLISNALDALFQVQESNFNRDVLNAIIWAIRHNQAQMYETGLETILILIKNITNFRVNNSNNIADNFYKTFYFDLIQEILCVLTDSYHKSGFRLQVEILQHLIQVVEFGYISEFIFEGNIPNKHHTLSTLVNLISNAFNHLNKTQIETFCIALFNKCYEYHDFKRVVRDFLTTLKSFSGNQEDLFEEEKKVNFY
jgi:exportin-1